MNFNVSPIAFYTSRAAQPWRAWYYQRKIAVVTGENLLPFLINDTPASAPGSVEIYEPNTDTLVATQTGVTDILAHVSTVDGQSVTSWIYQGTSSGIFGFTKPGYFYLRIGNYYSDIIKFGPIEGDFVQMEWQTFDDIITVDGTLLSKYIKHKLIFETDLWHPTYEVKEEGKENNGIYYQTSRTLTKTSGFSAIVNEAVLDSLYSIGNGDKVTIEARRNGVVFSYETNRVEVKNSVQSDDVESVQVEFDLFSIIRKYQQSENAPEPLPVPTPPPPPANYYIKGTATGNYVQFWINGTLETIGVSNGAFTYAYDTPLTQFANCRPFDSDFSYKAQNVQTLDFSESCGLRDVLEFELAYMTELTNVNFAGCTFESLTGGCYIVTGSKVTTLSLPDATFDVLPDNPTYGGVTILLQTRGMFAGNSLLTSVSVPNAVMLGRCTAMYSGDSNLKTVNMPLATFANATKTTNMFAECGKLETITMTAATFASVTDMSLMFYQAGGLIDGDSNWPTMVWAGLFPNSTAQPTTLEGMFDSAKFNEIDLLGLDTSAVTTMQETFANSNLRALKMTATHLSGVTTLIKTFYGCQYLNLTTTALLNAETFAAATTAKQMFANSGGGPADNLTLNAATFASVTDTESMFEGAQWKKVVMPTATLSNVTTAVKMFYNCNKATEIDLSATTFASLTTCNNIFNNCNAMQTLKVPTGSTMPCAFSLAQSSVLTVDSFNTLSQWVKDYSAGSIYYGLTVNSSAWNGWSSLKLTAETRLNAKKWNVIH